MYWPAFFITLAILIPLFILFLVGWQWAVLIFIAFLIIGGGIAGSQVGNQPSGGGGWWFFFW